MRNAIYFMLLIPSISIAGTTIHGDRTIDSGYLEFSTITAPSNPSATFYRTYAKDDSGTVKLCGKDSGGTESCGLGGGGAPSDGEYVTLSTDATLTDERVLTAGDGVVLTDGGAGSTITVDVDSTEVSFLGNDWTQSGDVTFTGEVTISSVSVSTMTDVAQIEFDDGTVLTSTASLGGNSFTMTHVHTAAGGNDQQGSIDTGAGFGFGSGEGLSASTNAGAILTLNFADVDSSSSTLFYNWAIPSTWNEGQIDINLLGDLNAVNNAIIEITSLCFGDGDSYKSTTFSNTPSSQTIAGSGSSPLRITSYSDVDMTGCSAGDLIRLRIWRPFDADDNPDTSNGSYLLNYMQIEWGEDITL